MEGIYLHATGRHPLLRMHLLCRSHSTSDKLVAHHVTISVGDSGSVVVSLVAYVTWGVGGGWVEGECY